MRPGNLRLDAYEAQNTPAAGIHAAYTLDRLAGYLQARKVVQSKARYQSSASAKAELLGSKVYAYLASPGLSPEDPSNIKRFISAVEGGGSRRVYRQELDGKRVAMTAERTAWPRSPARSGSGS
ncbi:MAG: hypothetical protein QM784_28010 [Polyangiaceae bacterium]